MTNPLAVELHVSGAETANGNGSAVDIGALRTALDLVLDVTAVSGTNPTLVVAVETSRNDSIGWEQVGTFEQVEAVGRKKLRVAGCEQHVRLRWVIGGTDTPSFTFEVSGKAHVLYASPRDVEDFGAPPDAWGNLTASQRARACIAATARADDSLRVGMTLPLVSWDESLVIHTAYLATWFGMTQNGFQPSGPDDVLVQNKDMAIRWLDKVGNGKLASAIIDSTPDVEESAFAVASDPPRGW